MVSLPGSYRLTIRLSGTRPKGKVPQALFKSQQMQPAPFMTITPGDLKVEFEYINWSLCTSTGDQDHDHGCWVIEHSSAHGPEL